MAKKKYALITGIRGQDGYYLAKHLISRDYCVVGQTRNLQCTGIDYPFPVSIVSFDLNSQNEWRRILEAYRIDEVYHLAGVSFVPASWNNPSDAIHANFQVTAQLLEALRKTKSPPKLFYASSSEVFGVSHSSTQNELTPLRPVNPYGVTKAASMGLIECYRKQYGLFLCSGILFNHESPRRDPAFVTRKISKSVAAIAKGMQDQLVLGNLETQRDWGSAEDFVDCMHRSLQHDTPEDFVIGTGQLTKLSQVVTAAFSHVGLDAGEWITMDPAFVRPNDTPPLVADSTKALELLGWRFKTSIAELICNMVDDDLRLLDCNKRAA